MTVVYKNDGPWGTGQHSPLSSLQADTNFWTLVEDIAAINADLSGGAVVSIASITQPSFNTMAITLTNGSISNFTLPSGTWRFRGAWQPSTVYAVGDVVQNGISLYLVIFAHTSGSTFDPGANDGMGHNYYQLLLSIQQAAPVQIWQPGDPRIISNVWTPAITDAGTYNRFEIPSPTTTIMLPFFSSVAFPVNTEMHFRQASTGALLVEAPSGIILNGVEGLLNQTDRQGATFTLKNIATDEWDLFGYLALA